MGRHRCVPIGQFVRCCSSPKAGSVAELAAARKSTKYTNLDSGYIFQPIAMETLDPINDSARDFLSNLGRKILFSQAMIEGL